MIRVYATERKLKNTEVEATVEENFDGVYFDE